MNRLPYDATTEAEVRQYFITRALQMAPHDIVWLGDLTSPTEGVYLTTFFDMKDNKRYGSFYILKQFRDRGLGRKAVRFSTYPIITVNDCGIIMFLDALRADFRVIEGMFDTDEYKLIEKQYGDQRAKRSQVLLMNHIDEGLYVLEKIGASDAAKRAYCLHPVVQTDEDLSKNLPYLAGEWKCDPYILALAMEYRSQANAWLSDKVIKVPLMGIGPTTHCVPNGVPTPGPLADVRDMLIADKIQNYKDFIIYHRGTHPRSDELDTYFEAWLRVLRVDNFQEWFDNLSSLVPTRFTNQGV